MAIKEKREYNSKGKIIFHKYPNGYMIWITYDGLGRIIKFKNSEGLVETTNYNDDNSIKKLYNNYREPYLVGNS